VLFHFHSTTQPNPLTRETRARLVFKMSPPARSSFFQTAQQCANEIITYHQLIQAPGLPLFRYLPDRRHAHLDVFLSSSEQCSVDREVVRVDRHHTAISHVIVYPNMCDCLSCDLKMSSRQIKVILPPTIHHYGTIKNRWLPVTDHGLSAAICNRFCVTFSCRGDATYIVVHCVYVQDRRLNIGEVLCQRVIRGI
jgi:hypothetical protein